MSSLKLAKLAPEAFGPDGLTDAERLLLAELRRRGLELVAAWCSGPNGAWQHRRVIRRRRAEGLYEANGLYEAEGPAGGST